MAKPPAAVDVAATIGARSGCRKRQAGVGWPDAESSPRTPILSSNQEASMAKVAPFHAEGSVVYHDNNQCTEGNNIERRNRKSGTGNKRKCAHCKRLR